MKTYLTTPESAIEIDAEIDRLKQELDQCYKLLELMNTCLISGSYTTEYITPYFDEDGKAIRGLRNEKTKRED